MLGICVNRLPPTESAIAADPYRSAELSTMPDINGTAIGFQRWLAAVDPSTHVRGNARRHLTWTIGLAIAGITFAILGAVTSWHPFYIGTSLTFLAAFFSLMTFVMQESVKASAPKWVLRLECIRQNLSHEAAR